MTEKRKVDDIIGPNEVGNVRGETPLERICRNCIENLPDLGAFVVIAFGMIVAVVAMIFFEALRPLALQIVAGAVSGALGFLFGSKRRRDWDRTLHPGIECCRFFYTCRPAQSICRPPETCLLRRYE